jgi:histidinol-phosphate aminotransferase
MSFRSKLADTLTPYVPGELPEGPDIIKLNTNENPYPPSPKVIEAMSRAVNEDLRLYPDPESSSLRRAIAKRHNVGPDQVFVGNGSDEVLALCFPAFCDPEEPVRFFDVTYSFYKVYASLFRIPSDIIRLNDDFTVPLEKCVSGRGTLIFPNPNAPTTLALSLDDIRGILQGNRDCVVIVDEAYCEFGCDSAVSLLKEYENLLVVKTVSKSHALAGIRVGYAIGSPDLIGTLGRVKNCFNSYPVDRVAQAGAEACMNECEYTESVLKKVIKTRDAAVLKLREFGFECPSSSNNFLFVRHPKMSAVEIAAELKKRGILVRHFPAPRISEHLRITVGTDEHMEKLYSALREILGNAPVG